jgi:hypothetical protein
MHHKIGSSGLKNALACKFSRCCAPGKIEKKKFYMPSTDWKIPLIQDTERLLKGK